MSNAPRIHVVVAAGAPDAVTRSWQTVATQSWMHVDQQWPPTEVGGDDLLVVLAAGTLLEVTAMEKAWWFLHTHNDSAFVTGIDAHARDGGIAKGLSAFIAIRARDVLQIADAEWRSDAIAPGLALALALLSRDGRRGRQLVEFTHGRGQNADVDARIAALAQAGLTDAILGDHASDPPVPALPIQSIDTRELPSAEIRLAPATAKRVLVLLQGFPMGGYAVFNSDLLPRLAANGNALTVCTTEWWRTTWGLDAVRNVTTDVFHAHGIVSTTSLPRYIDWLIASRRIDVVFMSHTFAGYRTLPWLRARHPNVAFVDYIHTDWFETGMYGSYAAMSASYSDCLDAQLASSDALNRDLVARGADAAGVRTCTINIDTKQWDPSRYGNPEIRKSLGGTDRDATLMLFAARVSSEKRPLVAFELFKAARANGHNLKFVVAGAGPQLAQLIQTATDAGLRDHCQFLGELDQEKLRFVYANCDFYCVPSEIEGVARTLYEAMAMGLPVIAADVGGQRELIVPECGVAVPHGPDEIAQYLAAIARFMNVSARKTAAAASRKRIVAHFSSEQCVDTIQNALAFAIERRRERQATLSNAMAVELAAMGLEIQRRHTSRAMRR